MKKEKESHTHQRTMFGLLGQQVKEALTTLGLGYNDYSVFSDQEYENRNNPDWKKSYTMEDKTIQLTYDDFISPLIKSVQELSAEVTELKAQLKHSLKLNEFMNTYIIEGGIGKQVAFTAIIDALVKKDKEKIQILSPYVDIFGGNTNIKYALDANTIPVHDKRILDSQNICYL